MLMCHVICGTESVYKLIHLMHSSIAYINFSSENHFTYIFLQATIARPVKCNVGTCFQDLLVVHNSNAAQQLSQKHSANHSPSYSHLLNELFM
jgi:hypothetical protein